MSEPIVIILSRPKIDLEIFYEIAYRITGRPVTKAIDKSMIPQTEPAKFISALAEFSDPEKDYKATYNVQTAKNELFFLYYVLVCYTTPETCKHIREWTKLDVTSQMSRTGAATVFLLGGNLCEWVRATTKCCSASAGFDLRLLFDRILLIFEGEGLGGLWFGQRKTTLPDETFLLEDKR